MYCSHIFTMLAYSMSNIWYTLFVCMCLYCVSWWCNLGTRHLIGSWSLTAQGYMLDLLGDVTSTVSFCQLSGGVCYPTNLCINFHASYRPTMCVKYAFCIVFEWYFVYVLFCLCFMYKFHYILESVYWFHSKPPYICACLVLCLIICQVGFHSELSVTLCQYMM